MKNNIIFAYSVDNQYYKGDVFKNAIKTIPERFDEISFLIADKIQLYNIAKRNKNLIESVRLYKRREYFEKSKEFIQSFEHKVNIDLKKSRFYAISDFYGAEYIEIFRQILIAYEIDSEFQYDVNNQIENYLADKQNSNELFKFSQLYILEEIALNIRMKQITKTKSEYYIGEFAESVVNIYRSKYSFNFNDFNDKNLNLNKFHFYEFDVNERSWNRK